MAQRDEKGRFVKGHQPYRSGGRAKRSVEEKFLNALRTEVKLDDWKKIIKTAIARAQSGDNVSRQWLSDYLLGKPKQTMDIQSLPDMNIRLTWDDADRNDNASEAA